MADMTDGERMAVEHDFETYVDPLLGQGRVAEMGDYVQHGSTTTLEHCAAVAYLSLLVVRRLGIRCDERALVRGAMLHDYFLYDWHDGANCPTRVHGFTHPGIALREAEVDFDLTDRERDIISHHMFPLVPLPPHHREGLVVSLVDKACSLSETLLGDPYAHAWGRGA